MDKLDRHRLYIVSMMLMLLVYGIALAVPGLITYQGKLVDTGGSPVTVTIPMNFALYNAPGGGTPLWAEAQSVSIVNGLYQVTLGLVNSIGSQVFATDTLYLGVSINGDGEMTPRQQITSVGYAVRAATADMAIQANSVVSGAITASMIAPGAIYSASIGESCAVGETLVQTASGWACGNPVSKCTSGIISNCYTGSTGTLGIGPCTSGTWICGSSGEWGTCDREVVNTTETCDEVDNDCDGSVDEGCTMWTWISGSDTRNQISYYGTKGVGEEFTVPGGRRYPVSWKDASGDLWVFGGYGYNQTGLTQLNDLWKYDGTQWIWKSGVDMGIPLASYGTKGVASSSNVPGGRERAVGWTDSSGNFWLFGGNGYNATTSGYLNDLWKFDGRDWTYIGGSTAVGQAGVYGTKKTAAPTNVPGGRYAPATWIDSMNNLWLFGGFGIDSTGATGAMNDLWKYDGTYWTWISGSNLVTQTGVYGTKGVANKNNIPGSRFGPVSWIDSSENLWLFGGYGYDAVGASGYLNDLWRFDGSNWTWISGSNAINQAGDYITYRTANAGNMPGGRYYSTGWIDRYHNVWLLGGYGYGSSSSVVTFLNDLWKFDGTNWTFMYGSPAQSHGTYGTKGTGSISAGPGSRRGPISWIDANSNLWLFGGEGLDASGTQGYMNDLWKFTE